MTSVSVIICAHTEERYDDLVEAVQSMQDQTERPLETIVSIDHNPALFERISERWADASDVVVIENTQERGLSGARNSGIAIAMGDVIAFLDDDAVAEHDWLENIQTGYADPKVAGIGGKINPRWLAGKPRWFPEEFNWVVGCTYRGMPTETAPVRNLIGANMSFRRDVFETAGLFRTGMGRVDSLPVGCEETEICIRYTQKKPDRVFLYNPDARVDHKVPGKRGTWHYFRSRCYYEGRSKAMVSKMVGSGDGLSSERSYTMRVLPLGVLRGIGDALFKLDFSGLGRSTAIVIGLLTTGFGYLRGARKPVTLADNSRWARTS